LIVFLKSGESLSESFDTRIVRFARSGMGLWNGKPLRKRRTAVIRTIMVAEDISRHGVEPRKRIIPRNLVELSPCNFEC
jgi:hypothetical protein